MSISRIVLCVCLLVVLLWLLQFLLLGILRGVQNFDALMRERERAVREMTP
jgi:hypothetical protein